MNNSPTDRYTAASKALSGQLLYHALTLMKTFAEGPEAGTFSDRIQSLETNYHYLTDYFLSGNDDPGRTTLLRQLTAEAYRLLDDLWYDYREQHISDATRALRLRALMQRTGWGSNLKDVFYRFLFCQDTQQTALAYSNLAAEDATQARCMAVAALTLNTLNRFAEAHMLLLCDIAATAETAVAQRALVGLVLLLRQYDDRLPFFPTIEERLRELVLTADQRQDLLYICRCLLETSLTGAVEQMFRSMQQDILAHPVQQKGTGPKHIIINIEELEEGNPDWGEVLNGSIGKHINRMLKLHQDGGDFNYTSTKDMLTDAFFRQDAANWFLPFDKRNPELGVDFGSAQGQILGKLLCANTDACDIDKYATCLACRRMQNALTEQTLPEGIREMSETALQEAVGESPNARKTAQTYIRTLYRFFRHNPWGYDNVMQDITMICRTHSLHSLLANDEGWLQLGDRCLGLQLYEEAEHLFRNEQTGMSVQLFQKLGYALQKQGKHDQALEVFRKALNLQDDDAWTLQHTATCLHRLGHYTEAIRLYDTLLTLQPDKKSYLQAKAQCLLENGQSEEALQLFYHLNFLFPDDLNCERGLAWCAFLCDRHETAMQYLERLANMPAADANDLLNYAHFLFLQKNRTAAALYYTKSRDLTADTRTFFRSLRKDKPLLLQKGISEEEMRLMEDTLMERFRPKG